MKKQKSSGNLWYEVDNIRDIDSPSLLIYPDRIEKNILKMIAMTGSADRLRPHVKTHKMTEVVRLQMKHGINKFKCATIAEVEMAAVCGANDILLAMQPVGPNLERFFKLQQSFPGAIISCIADDEEVIRLISDMAVKTNTETTLWLDINIGMNRTGISPVKGAADLYKLILRSPMLKAGGLHAYDGHLHEPDFIAREKECNAAFKKVLSLVHKLEKDGINKIRVVAGGTPTFPVHAHRSGVECSPGTLLLWDYKSKSSFLDMDFLNAAVILTRVVSKPGRDLICVDLGHKAIASEMPQPRIKLFGIDNYAIINHNEEHMVIKTRNAGDYKVGNHLYGIPWHICPTVDRYDSLYIVTDNMVSGQWNVEARRRKITI